MSFKKDSKSPEKSQNPFGAIAVLMNKYQRALAGSLTESCEDLQAIIDEAEEIEEFRKECSIIDLTFTPLQVAAFSSVIQETLDKINILGLIGGLPNVKTVLEYCPLIDKYEKEDTQSFIFDPETLEPYEGGKKKQMLIKFQKDRSYVEEVLKEAHEDLIRTASINQFMLRLKQFCMLEEERDDLLKETSENLAAVKNLTAHMEKDKVTLSNKLLKKSELLGQLKDEYEVSISFTISLFLMLNKLNYF
ncbi:hypothetical protein AMK59_8720 [Oryctes borbonicus]|uniref:Uncharacterized protein n=1 Tax=Oryctes borbonicus TaxID=1629725 RepID=A0A0T6AX40_9SCAR|nr:hypothetical protein AMK59_8720 [Oryctes borbonicus]